MYCPNCGKELPDGSQFCGYCGTQISENSSHPVSVNANEFSVLTKCFTDPYADEILSPVLSVIVFAAMFFINWLTFFRSAVNGLSVTAVVLVGMYLLEYIDKGHECDIREMTGRIGFHLVLPSVIMLLSGIFYYFFWNGLESYFNSLQFSNFSGNGMNTLPDTGVLVIGLILMNLSIVSFILIEAHGFHKKSTGFVYAAVIIITLILIASAGFVFAEVKSSALGEITSLIQELM